MLKIMTIVGTRPEIIKLSRVIAELERHTQHVLVHSGQNYDYELNQVFFEDLSVKKPDYFLAAAIEGNPAQTIAEIIARIDPIFAKEQPDAVLFYGDTNTCLAAIPAKRRKIPVFHMEAGNRCFDERVPEEINRRIIDHIADINLTLTEHARRYLLQEGIKPETIIKVGSNMQEIYNYYWPQIQKSTILSKLNLSAKQYFVISAHREENVDKPERLSALLESLQCMVDTYQKPILFSTHPRTKKRLQALQPELPEQIVFHPAFGFHDYISLMTQAYCVLSDSGSITEDASILNFPAVTIRQAHERPEGMDVGTLVMSDLHAEKIQAAIDLVVAQADAEQRAFAIVPDYDVANVSQKIVRIIHSYVDYIKRTVWYETT